MKKICGKIKRNCPIKEVAIQKQLYSILINNITNGWNPLVSKRLAAYALRHGSSVRVVPEFGPFRTDPAVDTKVNHDGIVFFSYLIHDSFEVFKLKLKKFQPHLRMSFGKR